MITLREEQNGVKAGIRFGRLEVLGPCFHTPCGKRWQAVCRCDCGTSLPVDIYLMKQGSIKSCGCAKRESSAATGWANRKHGLFGTHVYNIWNCMMQRCRNPKNNNYQNYGARGITVCEEWHDVEAFALWAASNGHDPELQIDRIDNNGGYNPGNCRFVSCSENCKNRRNTMWIEAFGERKVCRDWARDERCSVSEGSLHHRIITGWPAEAAITSPKGTRKRSLC